MNTTYRALVIPMVIGALLVLGGCKFGSQETPDSSGSPEINLPVEPSRSIAPIESPTP